MIKSRDFSVHGFIFHACVFFTHQIGLTQSGEVVVIETQRIFSRLIVDNILCAITERSLLGRNFLSCNLGETLRRWNGCNTNCVIMYSSVYSFFGGALIPKNLPEGCFNISSTSGKSDKGGRSDLTEVSSCFGVGKPLLEVASANDLTGLGGSMLAIQKKSQ